MRNYFSVFFSNTQVRTLISQPLDKRCSKASFSVVSQIYAKMWKAIFTKFFLLLELSGFFTTSDIRCSKASFSVVSQIYAKMWKAIFTKFFLLLETKRLFHNL
ncbi:hypothetical protein EJW99_03450 [Enterococcus faecium]|nr:hypothetical protein [Enterococcus faecium]